jgi:hypothetical protein
MDNNQEIKSWGKTFNKRVYIVNQIDNSKVILPIGNLNSYGDSCIPGEKFALKFQNQNEANKTITDFLVQRRQRLFGIPGKASVTIGGAIASDVHGKDNLWGGAFSKNIQSLEIAVSKDKKIRASRSTNSELFKATVGGLGLTGVITDVEFSKKLDPLSLSVETKITKSEGLDHMFDSFKLKSSTYWSAWIDLVGTKNKWISFSSKELPNKLEEDELKNIKFDFKDYEFSVNLSKKFYLNNINKLYYFANREKLKKASIFETLYPIKNFLDTRVIAGKKGLIQIQFVVPIENKDKIHELLHLLKENNNPILCSVKRLTNGEGYLSFCKDGWTFAIDFPRSSFNPKNLSIFYKRLHELNGLIYLAKDSVLDETYFKLMYQKFNEWEKVVKFYDPGNLFQSQMSHRLGLKNW